MICYDWLNKRSKISFQVEYDCIYHRLEGTGPNCDLVSRYRPVFIRVSRFIFWFWMGKKCCTFKSNLSTPLFVHFPGLCDQVFNDVPVSVAAWDGQGQPPTHRKLPQVWQRGGPHLRGRSSGEIPHHESGRSGLHPSPRHCPGPGTTSTNTLTITIWCSF